MDSLKEIEKDIKEVDKSIQRLTRSSESIDHRDHKSVSSIESSIDKARLTKGSLRREHHAINQDILKNEKIKAEILKLDAEVEFLKKQGQIEMQLEIFNEYIRGMCEDPANGIDGSLGGLGGVARAVNKFKELNVEDGDEYADD